MNACQLNSGLGAQYMTGAMAFTGVKLVTFWFWNVSSRVSSHEKCLFLSFSLFHSEIPKATHTVGHTDLRIIKVSFERNAQNVKVAPKL